MSRTSAFCIATSRTQAVLIRDDLLSRGFSHDDISTLFPDKATSREFAHEKHTKAPEGASAGAAIGGLLGGALGWLCSVGALAIPGVGRLTAGGPILGTLSAGAAGAAVGGIIGALIGIGLPEYEAKRFAGKLNAGNILISVHTENSYKLAQAKAIFKGAGAQGIATGGEPSAPREKRHRRQPELRTTPSGDLLVPTGG